MHSMSLSTTSNTICKNSTCRSAKQFSTNIVLGAMFDLCYQRRPLINFMAITESVPMFLKLIDESGEIKYKDFIA